MDQNETLDKPENLPKHCWPTLKAALAFDEQDRQTTVEELLASFSYQPTSLLQRLLGRRA